MRLETLEETDNTMEITQVYVQIEEQRDILVKLLNSRNPVSPNKLSDVCTKLAILNGLLGDFIPGLKMAQLDGEKAIYQAHIDAGDSATAANSAARTHTIQVRRDFETADIKHSDLWKLISMAQSHIRAVGDERKAG